MKIRNLYYGSFFESMFKHLPQEVREKAILVADKFLLNCFDDELGTKCLQGVLGGYWSFSVDGKYSFLFEFINQKKDVGLIDIADYSIYQKT